MRTQLIICTEADYLQAHLTVIVGESRRRNPVLHNLKQRVTSILDKLSTAAKAEPKPTDRNTKKNPGEPPTRRANPHLSSLR